MRHNPHESAPEGGKTRSEAPASTAYAASNSLLARDPMTVLYHELKSPLSLIVTLADATTDDVPLELVRERSRAIARSASRVLRTSERVLAAAQAAGELGVESSADLFAPVPLLREQVADLQALGAPVELSLDQELDEFVVRGLPAQLEALIQALVGNALEHGDREHPVYLVGSLSGARLELSISNLCARDAHEGLGISTYIATRLAHCLGATLTSARDDDEYHVRIELPLRRTNAHVASDTQSKATPSRASQSRVMG